MPQTPCQNSYWFGFCDLLKFAFLGPRRTISSSGSGSSPVCFWKSLLALFRLSLSIGNTFVCFLHHFPVVYRDFLPKSFLLSGQNTYKFSGKIAYMSTWRWPVFDNAGFYSHRYCFCLLFGTITPGKILIFPKFLFVPEKNTCENRVFAHRLRKFSVIRRIWGNWRRSVFDNAGFYSHRYCFYLLFRTITPGKIPIFSKFLFIFEKNTC